MCSFESKTTYLETLDLLLICLLFTQSVSRVDPCRRGSTTVSAIGSTKTLV